MGQFRANIFLIRITSNYFWALEVFENQRFKSHLFSFFQYKKFLCNYHSLLIKLKIYVNFQKNISPKMGLKLCSPIYKSFLHRNTTKVSLFIG